MLEREAMNCSRVCVPVHRWADGSAEECRLFICSSVVRLEVAVWHAWNTTPLVPGQAGQPAWQFLQTQQTIMRDNCGDCKFRRVGLSSAADPSAQVILQEQHTNVLLSRNILWVKTFLNTEFVFYLTTNVCHLSSLFRYARVRLDEWDTLIRKLSQQLSDKIMSLSMLLADPRWIFLPLVHSSMKLGLIKFCEGAGQNSAEWEAFIAASDK